MTPEHELKALLMVRESSHRQTVGVACLCAALAALACVVTLMQWLVADERQAVTLVCGREASR